MVMCYIEELLQIYSHFPILRTGNTLVQVYLLH